MGTSSNYIILLNKTSLTYTNILALFGLVVMLCDHEAESAKHWDNFLSRCILTICQLLTPYYIILVYLSNQNKPIYTNIVNVLVSFYNTNIIIFLYIRKSTFIIYHIGS